MIDHSLLNPTLTADDLEAGIRVALDYDVASVCILPYSLRRCAELLAASTVRPGTTIGFPHGGHTTAIKVAEAIQALADGGRELDMVSTGVGPSRGFRLKVLVAPELIAFTDSMPPATHWMLRMCDLLGRAAHGILEHQTAQKAVRMREFLHQPGCTAL